MDRQDQEELNDAAGLDRDWERLMPMSILESWTLSEGEPDIRGWEVRTLGGRSLGAVGDLLIDDAAGEVVLLDIDLSVDRRTLVPMRVADLDRARQLVLIDSADVPESDRPRSERARRPGRRAADAGTVRYPARSRRVPRAPVQTAPADSPSPMHAAAAGTEPRPERRHTDRRRIERLSTGF